MGFFFPAHWREIAQTIRPDLQLDEHTGTIGQGRAGLLGDQAVGILEQRDRDLEDWTNSIIAGDILFSYPSTFTTASSGVWIPRRSWGAAGVGFALGTPGTTASTVKVYKNGSGGTTLATLTLTGNTVTNVAVGSDVATITTNTAHGFNIGDLVVISGLTNTALNGTWQITAIPSTTTFTFTVYTSNISSTSDSGAVNQQYTYVTFATVKFTARVDRLSVVSTAAGSSAADALVIVESAN